MNILHLLNCISFKRLQLLCNFEQLRKHCLFWHILNFVQETFHLATSNNGKFDNSNSGLMSAQKVHLVPKCMTVFTLLTSNSYPSFIMKDKNACRYSLSNSQRIRKFVCHALLRCKQFSLKYFISNHGFKQVLGPVNSSLLDG